MEEENPLAVMDESIEILAQLLVEGKTDPRGIQSLFRKMVKEAWPDTDNNFSPDGWNFLYTRMNTYLLLNILKFEAVQAGIRGKTEGIPEDILYETYLSKEARENWREMKGLNW